MIGLSTDTDFLIVGSGIAGLRAAIAAAGAGRVLILTKADPAEGSTGYAQGGIAAAVGEDDNPELHAADTIRAGDGLCDGRLVGVLVGEGPRYVHELIDWGAAFDRGSDGRPALGREAAHSRRRVLHAGDATGREISRVLWEHVRALASVTTITHALVTELLADGGAVRGARYADRDGVWHEVRAWAVLLATGGAGQVFRETTNPGVATGDAVALAYYAGARLADLEFVQFHPTALNRPGTPRFLISEALRGEGARLVNSRGEPFMTRYHVDGDLAPRDVVARGIALEINRTGGPVCLTLAHLDPRYVHERFPTIADACRRVGLDLARDPIPVGPAAHYMMGGVDTDDWGRTSLPGLYAAGEAACTGVHGANRLASNSLLEGLVFGARAGLAMQSPPKAAPRQSDRVQRLDPPVPELSGRGAGASGESGWGAGALGVSSREEGAPGASNRGEGPPGMINIEPRPELDPPAIRDLMWRAVGLFRTADGLQAAVRALDQACAAAIARGGNERSTPDYWKRLNLVTVARLIARAAVRRQESRGAHFRSDFPDRDDRHWRVHVVDDKPQSSKL